MIQKKLIVLLFLTSLLGFSQKEKQYDIRTVAFYNVENLFDTINDTTKKDEYSPMMKLKSNRSEVYWDKINKLADVISQIGAEKTNNSPVVLGVSEVENLAVLQDLVKTEKLLEKRYGIVHFDSPDARGIDVALLYQPEYFAPTDFDVFNPNIYVDNKKILTRDILWVEGNLGDEKVHFIVNHWPSRRGGEEKSRPSRERAAYRVTQVIEKIKANDKNAKIIIMGDFNDDPTNSSFKEVLQTEATIENLNKDAIYNPYENMFKEGMSSLGYKDRFNLFDQILISTPLINKGKENNFSGYKMFKAGVFNKSFLTQKSGSRKGYPFRSFVKGKYTGGYSDHYPVYMYLIKEHK